LNALGTHLLLELRKCEPTQLDDIEFIRGTFLAAAEELGVTILSESFHQFSPQGVTGIISIAESHFSVHTWPEFGYAAVDIFTCGAEFEPSRAAEFIVQRLQAEDPEIITIQRGLLPVYAE
jgi:S-adenosylmethionine decarboxylase